MVRGGCLLGPSPQSLPSIALCVTPLVPLGLCRCCAVPELELPWPLEPLLLLSLRVAIPSAGLLSPELTARLRVVPHKTFAPLARLQWGHCPAPGCSSPHHRRGTWVAELKQFYSKCLGVGFRVRPVSHKGNLPADVCSLAGTLENPVSPWTIPSPFSEAQFPRLKTGNDPAHITRLNEQTCRKH